MAGSINKVILLGRVGQDPEIRATSNGKEIANLSLATSESWKDKSTGEKKEKTEWHRVVIFNEGLVNLVKNYVAKGTQLYVEGVLQTRKWQDSSGQDKYSTEIVLQNYNGKIVLLGGGDQGAKPQNSYSNQQSQDNEMVEDLDDDIPFN